MNRPVVIEAAINGVTSPEHNAAVPRLPEEIAQDALACFEAGAAIVHSHTHDPVRPPDEAAALYAEAYTRVLEALPDAILYPTMGVGDTIQARWNHHLPLAAEGLIRCAALDTGSVNLGASLPDGRPMRIDFVYTNSPNNIRTMMEECERLGLGPSTAIFEPGFLRVVLAAHAKGALPAGTLVKFYFSAGGYLGGGEPLFSAPPIPEALELYLAMLGDAALPWAVAVLGGSLLDSPIADLALERGGHLRVGLEDHLDGPPNAEQVAAAARRCAKFGRPVASPGEAAALLGLPPLTGAS
ncbi:MAG: 3-keto-5-aminohexanoate cleavage protein [Myxococcota bacterium]